MLFRRFFATGIMGGYQGRTLLTGLLLDQTDSLTLGVRQSVYESCHFPPWIIVRLECQWRLLDEVMHSYMKDRTWLENASLGYRLVNLMYKVFIGTWPLQHHINNASPPGEGTLYLRTQFR